MNPKRDSNEKLEAMRDALCRYMDEIQHQCTILQKVKDEHNQLKEAVHDAMEILEQASCGSVGSEGYTLEELKSFWERGQNAEDDAYYDTCQTAWRTLEKGLVNSQLPTNKDRGFPYATR